jgi:hypothetical protein
MKLVVDECRKTTSTDFNELSTEDKAGSENPQSDNPL